MTQSPDPPPLPIRSAILDDEQVAALFRDLRECVEIDEIIVKTGPGRVDDDQPQPTLDEVEHLLAERAVRGVQVRYRHDGARWMDTLMPDADGVRLIRVRHDSLNSP